MPACLCSHPTHSAPIKFGCASVIVWRDDCEKTTVWECNFEYNWSYMILSGVV